MYEYTENQHPTMTQEFHSRAMHTCKSKYILILNFKYFTIKYLKLNDLLFVLKNTVNVIYNDIN